MTRRPVAFAIAATLLLPTFALAQEAGFGAPPPTRFTVSPFVGYGFGYTQKGTARLASGPDAATADYERQEKGGVVLGLSGEARLRGPLSAVGTLAFSPRGGVTTRTSFAAIEDRQEPGGTMYIAKLGLQLDFHESEPGMQQHRAAAAVSVGPALVHQSFDDPADIGRASTTRFAVNAGAVAEFPLGLRNTSFRAVLEDYVLFLDDAAAAAQMSQWVLRTTGQPLAAQLDAGAAHLYVLRAGLSYRF